MINQLDQRIRQLHAALDGLASTDLSSIAPKIGVDNGGYYTRVDCNEGTDEACLANATFLLIHNIASLKNHLQAWCKGQGIRFEGDNLIDTNLCVALIHDLWNIDKHAELNRPPRSGHFPKLKGLSKTLVISAGVSAGSGAFFSMDPRTGKVTTGTTGGGSVQLAIVAQVVNENDQVLGDFTEICTQAIAAWRELLSQAGVPISHA